MLIGYARTSTVEQEAGLEGQERDLKALGCERIFSEHVSALAYERPKLREALAYVREGDVLVVTKPDRLARSVRDLLNTVEELNKKKVELRVLSMGLDTSGPEGKLMLTVLGAVAEFERDIMLARQREGIAKAKKEGRYKGRAPTARAKAEHIKALANEGLKKVEIAQKLGVGLRSVFRILNAKSTERDMVQINLPAVCSTCGKLFPSGIVLGEGTRITSINNVAANGRHKGPVLDGTFQVASGVLQVLKPGSVTRSLILQIEGHARKAITGKEEEGAALREVTALLPNSAAAAIMQFGVNQPLFAILVVLALLQGFTDIAKGVAEVYRNLFPTESSKTVVINNITIINEAASAHQKDVSQERSQTRKSKHVERRKKRIPHG